ncbi:hypothetical protein OYT88_08490 [Sporolactobacillus sp. CQH2019]|nr:hypothetical protein [Sporolactobacillus sp. CQH2019]MDD9148584.1 hypothetical protein [Sporolactobacillus sp. CQH2019]
MEKIHPHSHGRVDGGILQNQEATRVLLLSPNALIAAAVFQAVIVQ